MSNVHVHTAPLGISVNTLDPTRTLVLRTAFVRSMNRRFREFTAVIRKAIVDQDGFGLRIMTQELTPPRLQQFNFTRTSDKVESFMRWLQQQEEKGLLELVRVNRIGESAEQAWTNLFIYDSYKRGVMRGRSELRKAGYDVPSIEASGGIEAVLGTPFHIDRVGLIYTRTFNELKGITSVMDTEISQVLAQGLVDGDVPTLLARKIISVVDGSNRSALDLPIRYVTKAGKEVSYVMPAKQRAQTIARTEVIRAHHAATMQEYKNWGAQGFEVVAEWVTAGDDRVCDECAGYHGNVYSLRAMENAIPVHPNCRCVAIPIAQSRVPEADIIDEFVRSV